MTSERILSGKPHEEDLALDTSLRPHRLDDYIGQDKVKDNLRIAMAAAQMRGEPLDHVLLYGPPGLGKTTLSYIIAAEMGVSVRVTSGPAIERPGDLAAILTNLQRDDVLFIDEIHRLARAIEEILYPAMEDFALDLVLGKGPGARSVRLSLPRFTLVGSTTRYAMLSPPLRDRFGAVYRLDFYDTDAIGAIIRRSAHILGVEVDEGGVRQMAQRARGTPRVANRLLRRVRDYAQVMADGHITRRGRRRGAGAAGDRRAGAGRGRPQGAADDNPQVRRRARRPRHDRGLHLRRGRHDHGRLRAVPDAGRLPPADAARPGRDASRLRAPGPAAERPAAVGAARALGRLLTRRNPTSTSILPRNNYVLDKPPGGAILAPLGSFLTSALTSVPANREVVR